MTAPTPEEVERAANRKELAEAIADGFEILRARDEEREAKAKAAAAGTGTGTGGSADDKSGTNSRKSLAERLLGGK